jgi:hypothetical protein
MSQKSLRRYTDITALSYLLTNERITLLNPRTWDDRNDSYFLGLYKKRKRLASVLALCFAQAAETYHHWKVFAPGPAGICIHFRHEELLEELSKHHQIRSDFVEYKTIDELTEDQPDIQQLPFVKRIAFKDEMEFRIIYESPKKKLRKLDFPIPPSVIEKVTLSPWIDPELGDSAKTLLRSLSKWKNLQISRSSLIDNKKWKNLADSATLV